MPGEKGLLLTACRWLAAQIVPCLGLHENAGQSHLALPRLTFSGPQVCCSHKYASQQSHHVCLTARVHRCLGPSCRDKKLGDYSLRQQVPANADTDGGLDVVLLAAKYGHYDVVKTALDSGASVLTSDPAGNTALHLAVAGGTPEHMAIMQLLLERGAAHDATNEACYTPLLLASGHDEFCRCGSSCCVRLQGWLQASASTGSCCGDAMKHAG